MGFHKGTFPIRMTDAFARREGSAIIVTSGWTNEDGSITFHKEFNGKRWVASDAMSGLRICAFPTRKACAEWCVENAQKILDRQSEPFYIQRVFEFRDLIKEELARS